jgi:hypothetical protein
MLGGRFSRDFGCWHQAGTAGYNLRTNRWLDSNDYLALRLVLISAGIGVDLLLTGLHGPRRQDQGTSRGNPARVRDRGRGRGVNAWVSSWSQRGVWGLCD